MLSRTSSMLAVVALAALLAVGQASDASWNQTAAAPVPTNVWVVSLSDEGQRIAEQLASALGLVFRGRHASLAAAELFPNVVAFEHAGERLLDSAAGRQITQALRALPYVDWAERQVLRQHVRRSDPVGQPRDPLYASEWHLTRVNVQTAWRSRGGQGVQIAIVDDGLNWYNNPDFANYVAASSYDFNGGDADPTPNTYDIHGSEAAGVAAAKDDGALCGVGVAPHASLAAIRLIAQATSDADEAAGLSYKTQTNDIYSCSWGPSDDGRRLEGPGSLTYNAIVNNVAQGRDGLGTVYVWAGGNGRTNGDNCNYDGYANLPETIAIGALDSNDRYAYYSEPCAALVACAPSSGAGSTKKIVTSKSRNACSTSFGGTSAAAPLAAGLVALALEENPMLTWRDVQAVIIDSAVRVDATSPGWAQNGAGYWFSHDYGFGLMDAQRIVEQARVHTALPPRRQHVTPSQQHLQAGLAAAFTFDVPNSFDYTVEHVEVYLRTSGANRGRTSVTLTSPSGMLSVLQQQHADTAADINWTYMTIANWGEAAVGTWTLSVTSSVSFTVVEAALSIFAH